MLCCWFNLRPCALHLQMLLLSQDYGKHLLGVEDLLQKHALVEADISIQADRVRNVNSNAQKFASDTEGATRRLYPLSSSCLFSSNTSISPPAPPPPPQITSRVTLRSSRTESLTSSSATRS